MSEKAKRFGVGTGIGGAALCAVFALAALIAAAIAAIGGVLPVWAAALIVAGALAALAGIFGFRRQVRAQTGWAAGSRRSDQQHQGGCHVGKDPSELSEAIRAETIDALDQKADVKARGTEKANQAKKQAKAKASEIGDRVHQALPEQARPGVATVVDQAKSTTSTVGGIARDRPVVVGGAVLAVLVILKWRSRHRRRGA